VKLLDFGMAKVTGGKVRTGVGLLAGTPHYMSPEQIRQEAVSPRADVYGLGAVLFKLLTGRLPFQSDSLLEIVKMHLEAPPPRPSEHAPVSPRMDEIVLACMDKDPTRRPASMLELRELLRPIAERLGPDAMKHDGPERAEMTPTPATAKGLQELARSAAAPADKARAQRDGQRHEPRRSGWGAFTAVLISVCVVAAGVAVLRPWARRDARPSGDGARRAAPVAAAPVAADVPAAPPQSEFGVVSVQSDPPGAEVFADHVHQGVAPMDLTVQLPVEIKLTLEGYKTVRRKITHAGPIRIRLPAEAAPAPNLPRPPEQQEEGAKPAPEPEGPEALH
jgi:hypothetical protein